MLETIKIRLAGHPLEFVLHERSTAEYFREFCRQDAQEGLRVEVLPETVTEHAWRYEEGSSRYYIEHMELCEKTSDVLLPYGCCVFHCASVICEGKAYAFTGPSGTGKSTHYVLWKLLYGDSVQILNGDKPILQLREDGKLWLNPSPWKGKEGMGRMEAAPLGGIVCLAQGKENHIRRFSKRDAILPLYQQMLFTRQTVSSVKQAFALEDALLRQVPVWHLENKGDLDAARLCRDTILRKE